MLDITILAVGKIKKDYWSDAIFNYLKLLSPYAKIKIEEIKAEPFSRDSDKTKAKRIEGERIIKYLSKEKDARIIFLDELGKSMDSVYFSSFLDEVRGKIIFAIGGSLGFDKSIFSKDSIKISFSKMTFPHELARVFLLEQIYRAVTILNKKEYHH